MFVAKDYEIRYSVKLHNYFKGVLGRKDLMREFCQHNGIDYKQRKDRKYHLPSKYFVEHAELEYLSGIRDKLILSFYDDYCDEQFDNIGQQSLIREKIDLQLAIINDEKMNLQRYRNKLKQAKTAIDIIHFENIIESTKTRIANEKNRKIEFEAELMNKKKEYRTNIDNWHKQISILESIFEVQRYSFEKNVSKIVRMKLNYTDFYSRLRDYSDDVRKIITGEIYEKEKA